MATNGQEDAMDTSQTKSDMGPPATVTSNGSSGTPMSSPAKDTTQPKDEDGQTQTLQPASGAGAAAASNQPKVVQTAFIHKLYK